MTVMAGTPLEQLKEISKNYGQENILQLTDFLLYVTDVAGRVELLENEKRKINIVYHEAWYFRDKLVRNYAGPDEFDVLPPHIFEEHTKETKKTLVALLTKKGHGLRTSVAVPAFLARQMDSVVKKLEGAKTAPEKPENKLGAEYYVTKENDQYYYEKTPLKLTVGTQYRLAFDILFDLTNGRGGVCRYQDFEKELRKRNIKFYNLLKKKKGQGEKGVREWSQDNLTVKSKGILYKVPKKDLVTTKEGVGFSFNNRK